MNLEEMSNVLGSEYLVGDAASQAFLHSLPAWSKLTAQEQKALDDLAASMPASDPKMMAEIRALPVDQQLTELKQSAQMAQTLSKGINVQMDLAKGVATTTVGPSSTSKAKRWAMAPAWKNGPARWKIGAGVGAGAVAATLLGVFLKRR